MAGNDHDHGNTIDMPCDRMYNRCVGSGPDQSDKRKEIDNCACVIYMMTEKEDAPSVQCRYFSLRA